MLLNEKQAKLIGTNFCLGLIGRDFALKNKDNSCAGYSSIIYDDYNREYIYCYIGVSEMGETPKSTHGDFVLDGGPNWDRLACCRVYLDNGEVIEEVENIED